ncbi:FKBP-type peptidyl-prolyl cis-trans isomerase [Permianibacter aggregans]|uniref:Peptidyl-prolyl cis-trans isomerase n=1 Tax=Permianibacter aggregans TaxID=1510150 RepID=A0A4R6U9Z2_9GAMM|nr:FKBP-type peptidyl-prolyl cis-trans isomerase [Permianibacter aggregans]QGX40714.1 FKBP-type peptidyl-prolyl cis-trans isomerase [Permianibacter aggregans]TDQ41833.1 peptidylprolyl isomerase [Permianibacter aggregans]
MSTLEITDLVVGDGNVATEGTLVTAHYTGWFEDGTPFDSSHFRGRPIQCVLGSGRVIQGWDKGMLGMKTGGKRKLFVPAHMAYGERGIGHRIRPNTNLMFEIELLDVVKREA